MISDNPKFSIGFPIGGFGNHVRWLLLLDDRYQFDIKLVDYKIDIPKIVFAKIAEVIRVSSKINYVKK